MLKYQNQLRKIYYQFKVLPVDVVAYIHLDYLAPEYTRFFMFPYSPSCYYYDKPINIVPSNEMYEFEMRYFVGNLIYDVEGCINSFDEAIHLIDKINEGLKYEF